MWGRSSYRSETNPLQMRLAQLRVEPFEVATLEVSPCSERSRRGIAESRLAVSIFSDTRAPVVSGPEILLDL